MRDTVNRSPAPKRGTLLQRGEAAFGLTGGAAFATMVDSLPSNTYAHHFLLLAIPFLTLGCGALYSICYEQADRLRLEMALRGIRKLVEREISNPSTTPAQKEKLIREREAVVEAAIDFHKRLLVLQ